MRRRGNLKEYIASLEKEFSLIENGFKEEEKRALTDYKANDNEYAKNLAFLAYKSDTYQVRMYGVFLFGYLSEQADILAFMRDEVSKDDNWRVQEVLAKAFDEFCKKIGYEKALPIIDEWLKNNNPNTRRAVTEGLRIWTSRPYFKDNPNEAIERIANLKEDASEYVRKSVGNALRDISKKFPELIKIELDSWKLESKKMLINKRVFVTLKGNYVYYERTDINWNYWSDKTRYDSSFELSDIKHNIVFEVSTELTKFTKYLGEEVVKKIMFKEKNGEIVEVLDI